MSKINPKLNLNQNAQSAENASLVFAKDIRLDEQLNIRRDYGHHVIDVVYKTLKDYYIPRQSINPSPKTLINVHFNIIGHIVGLNKVYIFVHVSTNITGSSYNNIIEYDDITNKATIIKCSWTWNGGEISGCVSTNNIGDIILTIAETKPENSNIKIPLKHINLSTCTLDDNESIYTQAPLVPITNILLEGYNNNKIPTGVYIFYVRYEIKKDVYTPWYLASRPLFTGYQTKTNTIQGTLKHLNLHSDSNLSFKLKLDSVYKPDNISYSNIQLGFILSHDDGNVARSWKKFEYNSDSIIVDFSYNQDDIEEINIDDLQLPVFDIYNVGNVISNNNKLYCSNYEEDVTNEKLIDIVDGLSVTISSVEQQSEQTITETKSYLLNKELEINNNIVKFKDKTPITDYATLKSYENLNGSDLISVNHKYIKSSPINNEGSDVDPYNSVGTIDDYVTFNECKYENYFPEYRSGRVCNCYDYVFKRIGSSNDIPETITLRFGASYQELLNSSKLKKRGAENLSAENIFDNIFKVDTSRGIRTYNGYYPHDWWNYGMSPKHTIYNEWNNMFVNKVDKEEFIKANNELYLRPNFKNINTQYVKSVIIGDNIYGDFVDANNSVTWINVQIGSKICEDFSEFIEFISENYYFHKYDVELSYIRETNIIRYLHTRKIEYTYNFNYNITTSFRIKNNVINTTTLMPCARYNFYIHFVKNNGYITQGIPISKGVSFTDSGIRYGDNNEFLNILYPDISGDLILPYDYVAFFISIGDSYDKLSHLINHKDDNVLGNGIVTFDSIEADSLLYPITNNFKIIEVGDLNTIDEIQLNTEEEINSEYHPACDPKIIKYFEKPGYVECKIGANKTYNFDKDYLIFINPTDNDDSTLIKISPYCTSLDDYNNFITNNLNDFYLTSFICTVSKLDFNQNSIELYRPSNPDGTCGLLDNTYTQRIPTRLYVNSNEVYNLFTDNTNTLTYDTIAAPIPYNYTEEKQIYSNFNLNCVSLQTDLSSIIRGFTTQEGDIEKNNKQIINCVESNNSSSILELKSMFYNFAYQKYAKYKPEDRIIYRYDNTIRISDVIQDETNTSIFKFHPLSYKHIPTHRGIIILMFSLNNSIYIHTEHAIFKIDNNSTLHTEENQNVQLGQPNLENLIVRELFDSKVGFAGISKKDHACVLFSNYVFYDSFVNKIYAYGGDTQIICISDSIANILNKISSFNVKFINDEIHDRFFVNLYNITEYNKNICLSFNLRSKSFASIHSFDFDDSISTRSNTFILKHHVNITDGTVTNNITKIVNINRNELIYDNDYKKQSYIFDIQNIEVNNSLVDLSNKSIIDIIFNQTYEKIQVLNAINWICSRIGNGNITFIDNNGEENHIDYIGDVVKIITDSTNTDYLDLTQGNPKNAIADYDKPRDNVGIWTFNYFRDVRQNEQNPLERSLIYGKYFIIRFILSNNFKFENVFINSQDYEKI